MALTTKDASVAAALNKVGWGKPGKYNVTAQDVTALARSVLDHDQISSDEIADLEAFYKDWSASPYVNFSPQSREAHAWFGRFIEAMSASAAGNGFVNGWSTPAERKAMAFMKRTGASKFPNCDRLRVGLGMLETLQDPGSINQGDNGLCGPASFLHTLVRDFPVRYVDYVIGLFETGRGKLGTLEVEPSEACRHHKPRATDSAGDRFRDVDWVALASLRDSENWWFEYGTEGSNLQSRTGGKDMQLWLKAQGYTDVRWLDARTGTLNLKRAQGWRIHFLLDSKVIKGRGDETVTFPTHWVTLTSHIKTSPSVSCTVFTWADGHYPLPQSGTLSESDFEHHIHQAIGARL